MDVSFLIPARREIFLRQTIENILANIRGDSEIVAVCDGGWPDPPIPDHPRVVLIYHSAPIGQRAATNEAARVSRATYVCKIDAHTAIDEGFDLKMMAPYESGELGHDATSIPAQFNLHAFDWQCRACGDQTYQGPTLTVCAKCGKSDGFDRVIVWQPRWNRRTEFWRFDSNLHFQYHSARKKHPDAQGEIADTMSSLGACFFMRRDRFFDLGGLDEAGGVWGQFGVEVACKSWLSGGRHVTNKRTWFAHMFRTRGGSKGDFGFTFPLFTEQVEQARAYSRNLWYTNSWKGQTLPLSWLIEKFSPLPDWHEPSGAERLAEVMAAGEAFYRRTRAA